MFSTWISDISKQEGALQMIKSLSTLLNVQKQGRRIIHKLEESDENRENINVRVAYLIWQNPYMTIGSDTYIHDALQRDGFYNVFSSLQRYPVVTLEEITKKRPQLVFLSSEPFPFKKQHQREIEKALNGIKSILVDGEYFSWYGSRKIHLNNYKTLLQKETMKWT